MTPKEKAKELVDKYVDLLGLDLPSEMQDYLMKDAARICVNEIISAYPLEPCRDGYYEVISDRHDEAKEFWQQVLEEIDNI